MEEAKGLPSEEEDLRKAQTVEEILSWAVSQIPKVCPGWTNYNSSDPGITLLEVLAWLKEIQDFHMEQTGTAYLLEFLKLLGGKRLGKRPGFTYVTVSCREGMEIPADTQFYAGDLPFETVKDQTVVEGNFVGFRSENQGETVEVKGDWLSEGREISLYPFGTKPAVSALFTVLLYRPLKAGFPYGLYVAVQKNGAKGQLPVDESAFDHHGFYPLAEIALEYSSPNGFQKAVILTDETYGFCQSGMLRFRLDGEMAEEKPALRFALNRCDYLIPPVIVRLSLAMIPVLQKERVDGTMVFKGNGFPSQQFSLDEPDLYEESVSLAAESPEGDGVLKPWSRVTDFDVSGPWDRHFVLEDGVVTFGDSIHGMAPEGTIRIGGYERTLGRAGNGKAGTIRGFPAGAGRVAVTNEADVTGGFDGESVSQALERRQKELKEPFCAVTAADYEELVKRLPGLAIEDCRAYCREGEAHTITLAVKPWTHHGRGVLNEAYQKNIYRYLEERRMAGTRIELKSPEYYGFSVTCEAVAKDTYREAQTVMEAHIRQWAGTLSFGQEVSVSSLYGRIDSLPCIRRINGLYLDFGGLPGREVFRLPPWGLAVLDGLNCVLMNELS